MKRSKLKIIGSIGFTICIFGSMLYLFVTDDNVTSAVIAITALPFALFMMVGMLNDYDIMEGEK